MRVNACSIRVAAPRGKQSEDSWQKEGGLSRRFREEPCWQCSMKPWQLHERLREMSCTKARKLHEGSGKEPHWQCSTKLQKLQERPGENSRYNSAAWSRESYPKDPEKSRARNHENYMKDPAKEPHWQCKSYKKDLEKSRWNETGLVISYKSKKTAAA